jgi:choline dehydrogenase-like flavoprotein
VRAGRALGGSTAINGMAWSKPHSFQVSRESGWSSRRSGLLTRKLDALETVGNAGVNWNSLQPYVSLNADRMSPLLLIPPTDAAR